MTSFITGDATYSLRVTSTTSKSADYFSKEGANAPQLVLTLGGTPSLIPTKTATL